jgi:hypothetical protein
MQMVGVLYILRFAAKHPSIFIHIHIRHTFIFCIKAALQAHPFGRLPKVRIYGSG